MSETLHELLARYAASHRHPANEAVHWVCVPVIVLSILGLLWSLPVPAAVARLSPFLNWGTVALAAALAWWLRSSPALGAGMVAVAGLLIALVVLLEALPWPLWQSCAVLFVAAWTGQVVGHRIEGRKPSFLDDVRFLMIGPLWLLEKVYRRWGLLR